MLSKYLTIALKELPWAETTTLLPDKMAGQIWSCQKGSTLSTVSFKHSVNGKQSKGKSLYLESFPGNLINLMIYMIIIYMKQVNNKNAFNKNYLSSVVSKPGGLIS